MTPGAGNLAVGAEGATGVRLAFRIGTIGYMVAMGTAAEVVPLGELASVPWTQPWYRGLTNLRGRLYSVIDLAQFSGAAPTTDARPQLLVLGDGLNAAIGILITRAYGLRNLNDLQLVESLSDPSRPWEIARYRDADGTLLTDLNLARLVAYERFRAIAA